jgi:hypothetical protein
MRRIVTIALTVLMAFSLMLSLQTTASANAIAGGGYNSSYSGESVFTNQPAGGSGQFSAIFFNSGTQTWAAGVVGLLICDSSKTACNVASPNAAYASGWFSTTVYATVSASVPPGSNGFFVYNFTVPAGTAPGTVATFNGDVGLIANGTELRPEGYFQINTAPGSTGGMTISPSSASMPVGGQQQFTVSGAPAGSSTTWTVAGGCGAVTNSGLFAATATNSPTQPCSVTASAGGASATAPIMVFGPATAIRCSATKATIPADASTITTVQGTLIDANGNAVTNDNSTAVTFTNNTPAIMTERNATQPSPRTAQSGVASKDYFAAATGNSGTGVISLSSGSLTGCSESITVTGPGAATALAASFYLGTISADGTSNSVLEVDVVDANGVTVSGDGSSQITISRTSGASVCNNGLGGGSGGPTTVTGGTAYFAITSTSTPGTCAWQATSNATNVTAANATLTTVITGAANNLAIAGNASPKAADGYATLRVTVALKDASGNPFTTPTSQVTVTATLGSGCSGTKADGNTGSVGFNDPANKPPNDPITPGPIQGTTTAHTAATGSYSGAGNGGGSTNYARFVFRSTYATPGCTVSFTDGATVSSTTATLVFTAGGPAGVACAFSPKSIAADNSSTSLATVSIVDAQKNLATTGTYSVGFSKTGGAAQTTLLTASPQNTSNGIATFSVKSDSAVGQQTDTYTASTTIVSGGTASTGTCALSTPVQ